MYPFISNYLMSLNQQAEISGYKQTMENISAEELNKSRDEARAYNDSLSAQAVLHDPFSSSEYVQPNKDYESLLNLGGDGIMGYIEIARISLSLPIYHGSDTRILEKSIIHLPYTSLPIGGKGTHCVVTGHSGLNYSKLFTDLDRLTEGDIFLVHTLDETLAYEVDQIKTVLPDVTEDLSISAENDYFTLVTCTPYGVNTHRLLVRGKRIPYTPEMEEKFKNTEAISDSTWMAEYKRALIIGVCSLAIFLALALTVRLIFKRIKKTKAELTDGK